MVLLWIETRLIFNIRKYRIYIWSGQPNKLKRLPYEEQEYLRWNTFSKWKIKIHRICVSVQKAALLYVHVSLGHLVLLQNSETISKS